MTLSPLNSKGVGRLDPRSIFFVSLEASDDSALLLKTSAVCVGRYDLISIEYRRYVDDLMKLGRPLELSQIV